MLISREAAIPEVDGCSVAKAFTTWGEAVRVTCVDSPAHSIAGSEQGPITELNMTGTCEAFVALSRFKCLRNRVCPSSVRGRRCSVSPRIHRNMFISQMWHIDTSVGFLQMQRIMCSMHDSAKCIAEPES